MEGQQVGWIAALVAGAIAGWLAERFVRSSMSLPTNILFGIIGAAVASLLFGLLGKVLGGMGYLVAGFTGACVLIAIGRVFSGRSVWDA